MKDLHIKVDIRLEKERNKNMAFKKNGSLTIEQLKKTEEKLGHRFPNDYKEFLLKTNGGRIDFISDDEEHGFYVDPIDEEDICIDSLYGIGEGARDWLVYFNKLYADEIMGCLIIGDTLSHGFIVYDYLGVVEDDGGIYFWDDKRAYKTSSDEGNLYFVAENFNELMKKSNFIIE